MAHRRLRSRYGRSQSHLPRSRLSLEEYQKALGQALVYLGMSGVLKNAEERMLELNGWREGKKAITTALAIEKIRRKAGAKAR